MNVTIMNEVSLAAYAYPAVAPRRSTSALRLLDCTGIHQQASLTLTAILSDGMEQEVTSFARYVSSNSMVLSVSGTTLVPAGTAGHAIVLAACVGYTSNSLDITVSDHQTMVTSVRLSHSP